MGDLGFLRGGGWEVSPVKSWKKLSYACPPTEAGLELPPPPSPGGHVFLGDTCGADSWEEEIDLSTPVLRPTGTQLSPWWASAELHYWPSGGAPTSCSGGPGSATADTGLRGPDTMPANLLVPHQTMEATADGEWQSENIRKSFFNFFWGDVMTHSKFKFSKVHSAPSAN